VSAFVLGQFKAESLETERLARGAARKGGKRAKQEAKREQEAKRAKQVVAIKTTACWADKELTLWFGPRADGEYEELQPCFPPGAVSASCVDASVPAGHFVFCGIGDSRCDADTRPTTIVYRPSQRYDGEPWLANPAKHKIKVTDGHRIAPDSLSGPLWTSRPAQK